MQNRVEIYKGKDGETELAIHISYEDMYNAVTQTKWFDGLTEVQQYSFESICDWCAKKDDEYTFFPELGHKVMCNKCAKEHRKIVKWYTEDLHAVFNTLITFILTYELHLSDLELDTIDEFFSSKGHNEIHIRSFYKKEGE